MSIPDDEGSFRQEDYGVEPPPPPPSEPPERHSGFNEWLLVVALVLVIAVIVAVGYTVHAERNQARLSAANGRLAAQLTNTQAQLTALTQKLASLTAPPAQPVIPADETLQKKPERPRYERAARHVREHAGPSKWQRQMQQRLSAQQQRLSAAEQAIAKTQADFASNASSTQDSLNNLGGTVARNHAQLVELERQGQRNYYEFDLFKSKRFSHEGPVGLKLRHTSTKHENYNIEVLVNDSTISKKNVDLYEPVVLVTSSSPQPLELVVNRIDKNHVHGYVSVPKSYSERASLFPSTPAGTLSLTPVTTQTGTQPAAQPAAAHSAALTGAAQPQPELTVSH